MSSFTSSSIPCGSIAGIPIRLHYTLPFLFVVALLAEVWASWASVGWAALMYGPVLLGTVIIHELGHSLAARRVGGEAEGILLWCARRLGAFLLVPSFQPGQAGALCRCTEGSAHSRRTCRLHMLNEAAAVPAPFAQAAGRPRVHRSQLRAQG